MIELDGQSAHLDELVRVALNKEKVKLSERGLQKMKASRAYINERMKSDEAIYGVNTGFGAFSSVRISKADLQQLQKNIIRSHSVGVGLPFTEVETRAIMYLRANALANGHSGIRPDVVEKILEFLNHDLIPVIPQQGSVGASGDLAPLSHLALALIGEGEVWKDGKIVSVQEELVRLKIAPLALQAKEGLSLINGCQVMTAVGFINLYGARRLMGLADSAGAMSLEALRGSRRAYHPLISQSRPHPGEAITARNMRKILGESSPISDSHVDCDRVQDAYSLRCIPAVHGAAKNAVRNTLQTLEIEANSSTDNPLVFADAGEILSGGNFHGEPVAFALDFLAIAISAIGSISECRMAKLINPAMSGLPAHLAVNGGLNSAMMMVQVGAASLVSENKILSHPASVDSIPTNADKEDHVSMGTIAARKLTQILANVEQIVAMEFLCASQALDLIKPLKPAGGVLALYDRIRKDVPFAAEDRVFARDIGAIHKLIQNNELVRVINDAVGELEW